MQSQRIDGELLKVFVLNRLITFFLFRRRNMDTMASIKLGSGRSLKAFNNKNVNNFIRGKKDKNQKTEAKIVIKIFCLLIPRELFSKIPTLVSLDRIILTPMI